MVAGAIIKNMTEPARMAKRCHPQLEERFLQVVRAHVVKLRLYSRWQKVTTWGCVHYELIWWSYCGLAFYRVLHCQLKCVPSLKALRHFDFFDLFFVHFDWEIAKPSQRRIWSYLPGIWPRGVEIGVFFAFCFCHILTGTLGNDQPKFVVPEIWNQNSGPPGQDFDSEFPRFCCECAF